MTHNLCKQGSAAAAGLFDSHVKMLSAARAGDAMKAGALWEPEHGAAPGAPVINMGLPVAPFVPAEKQGVACFL
jgi:hypothetical protein